MNSTADFWIWFTEHAARLLQLEGHALVDEVQERLGDVDPRLGVEVSAEPTDEGNRELFITAFAVREAIPVALELVSRAPPLRGWELVALRPPGGFDFSFENDHGSFEAGDLRFISRIEEDRRVIVTLLVPAPIGAIPPDERNQLGWQILNVGLGELLAAQIDELEVVSGNGRGEPIESLSSWLGLHVPAQRVRN